MKIAKHKKLIRVAKGWLRAHRFNLNPNRDMIADPKTTDTSDHTMNTETDIAMNTETDITMNEVKDTTAMRIEDVQQEYWKTLQNGLPKPEKPDEVEMVETDTEPQPEMSEEHSKPVVGFDKHQYISEKMVELILDMCGIELERQVAVDVFGDNPRFLEARNAAVQAQKYMLGVTYGVFYYNKLATHPDCIAEFHDKFISGANLSLHHPVLNCRNKIANWHRRHGTSSIHDHNVMMDILETHFRQFVASRATKQAA